MNKNKQNQSVSKIQFQAGTIIKPANQKRVSSEKSQMHNASKHNLNNSVGNARDLSHVRVKKSSTIIVAICAILGIIIIGVLLFGRNYLSNSQNSNKNSSSNSASFQITANSKDDFVNVCNGNAITNATSYTKIPRRIVLFEEGDVSSDKYYPADNYIGEKKWIVKDDEFNKINLVGCLKHTANRDTGLTCNLVKTTGDKNSIKLFTVKYRLFLREAQSGKTIGEYDIDSTSVNCPTDAYYSESSNKIFTSPDKTMLMQSISTYIN